MFVQVVNQWLEIPCVERAIKNMFHLCGGRVLGNEWLLWRWNSSPAAILNLGSPGEYVD